MLAILEEGVILKIEEADVDITSDNKYLAILSYNELDIIKVLFNLETELFNENYISNMAYIANGENWNLFSFNMLNYLGAVILNQRVYIYMSPKILIVVAEKNQIFLEIINKYIKDNIMNLNFSNLLYCLLKQVIKNDGYNLDLIDQEIVKLEDNLITGNKINFVHEILIIRKKLNTIRKFHEQLFNILYVIQENENQLIDSNEMGNFEKLENRIERLYQGANSQRDYITQVREAYQSMLEIGLDAIMKYFTIITTIFLPLTIIASWYGMNFNMPELEWSYGYLYVIGLSITIIGICIAYFKKVSRF